MRSGKLILKSEIGNEKDLSWILLDGNIPVDYERLDKEVGRFDVIFNTVPALLLKETHYSPLLVGISSTIQIIN